MLEKLKLLLVALIELFRGKNMKDMKDKTISKNGIKLLSGYEQLRLKPYDDKYPNEILKEWNKRATIGYGHLILKNEWNIYKDGITKEEAVALKQKDMDRFIKRINKDVNIKQNQNQFDALVILSYNIGETGFHNSTVRKMLNDSEYKSRSYKNLEQAWKAWNKDTDDDTNEKYVSDGLVNRRAKEWKLYNKKIKEG